MPRVPPEPLPVIARSMVPRVYAIADAGALGSAALPGAVAAIAEAGIGWIQLRAKRLSGSHLYRLLADCCRAVAGSGARLWIDDRVDLAALLPVAGVHLGQEDLPAAAAREILGVGTWGPWIGSSTHDDEQVAAAAADPTVDVVAVGPVFPTTSKERPDPVVGLGLVRRARAATPKPLVAIGGIDAGNLAAVLAAGADCVAVLGALGTGERVGDNCRRLLAAAGCASF